MHSIRLEFHEVVIVQSSQLLNIDITLVYIILKILAVLAEVLLQVFV